MFEKTFEMHQNILHVFMHFGTLIHTLIHRWGSEEYQTF